MNTQIDKHVSSKGLRKKFSGAKENKKVDLNPKNNIKEKLQKPSLKKSVNPNELISVKKVNNFEIKYEGNKNNNVKKESSKKVNIIYLKLKQPPTKPQIKENKKDNKNVFINVNNEKSKNVVLKVGVNEPKKSNTNIPQLNKNKNNPFVKLGCEKNQSYIISTLYCLANDNNLKKYLLDLYSKKDDYKQSKNAITFLFVRILSHLQKKDIDIYSIEKFYHQIKLANCIFEGNEEEKNVVDFVLFLLDKFHEDDKSERSNYKTIKLKEEMYYLNTKEFQKYLNSHEKSFILDNYAWINKKIMKCLGCKKEIKTHSYYFTYDLNISSAINKFIIESSSENNKKNYLSIKQSIEYNLKPELLFNVYCSSCDKKTNFERQNLIFSSNDNIIILLNGIQEMNIINSMKENNIFIEIDKILELPLEKVLAKKRQYKINSVIYYDFVYKRYINYCCNNNIWIRYTANNITEQKSDEFLNNINYNLIPVVIFYSAN